VNYLSVCSGIEAATVAWHPLGWNPVGFSDIEKFPSEVLKHHYPNVTNFGDMTKYKEWNLGTVDLLVGGTPCQSFSVAGLRKGLEDPRGNLALVYCGILDHFRPKWFVWENVPGVLSSGGGRDFGSFLGAVAELGYGFAYRVLDAQYFGVAQRRRRVFVVGCLGDWRSAAEVLFEPESLRRDNPPSREKREKTTPSFASGSEVGQPYTLRNTLTARMHKDMNSDCNEGQTPVLQPVAFQQNTRDEVRYINGDGSIVGALAASAGMKQTNYLMQPIALAENTIGRQPHNGGNGDGFTEGGPMYTLNASDVDERGIQRTVGTLCADTHPGAYSGQDAYTGRLVPHIVGALTAKGPEAMGAPEVDGQHYIPVAHTVYETHPVDSRVKEMGDVCQTVTSRWGTGGGNVPIALGPTPYRKSKRAQSADDDETWVHGEVSNTINLFDQGDIRTTHAVVQPIALAENTIGRQPHNGGNGDGFTVGGPMYTLNATGVHGVAQPIAWDEELNASINIAGTIVRGGQGGRHDGVAQPICFSSNMSNPDCQENMSPALKLGGHGGNNPPAVAVDIDNTNLTGDIAGNLCAEAQSRTNKGMGVMQSMAVRRLTPVECERLQGFPDNYTNIPWRKSDESPDGPRYKALGNSMAVPVMAWIGRRIQEVESR